MRITLTVPRVSIRVGQQASVNNHALYDGYYTVSARVDNHVEGQDNSFADNRVSISVVVDRPDGSCTEGSAYASVSGFDINGNPYSMDDAASF